MARSRAVLLGLALTMLVGCSSTPIPPAPSGQGLAARYPNDLGIQDDPAVLSFDPFESETWYRNWNVDTKPPNGDVVSAPDPADGYVPFQNNSLRVTVPGGSTDGISVLRPVNKAQEIYFRYYLRFGKTWRTLDGGKLPGITGNIGTCGYGGESCNGADGWSARGAFDVLDIRGRVPIGSYIYDGEMEDRGDTYGTQYWWKALARARWYCVEHYVKLNTPGQRDGIYRGWVDGVLVFEKTDFVFRKVAALTVESIWMNVYHGGTAPVDRTIHLYIDNLVVAATYIGPMSAAVPTRVPIPAFLGRGATRPPLHSTPAAATERQSRAEPSDRSGGVLGPAALPGLRGGRCHPSGCESRYNCCETRYN